MLMIKRYRNRKLYNTSGKDYITLRELGRQIQKGEEIFVIEDSSKENITALVLSQILTEQIRDLVFAKANIKSSSNTGETITSAGKAAIDVDIYRARMVKELHEVVRWCPELVFDDPMEAAS